MSLNNNNGNGNNLNELMQLVNSLQRNNAIGNSASAASDIARDPQEPARHLPAGQQAADLTETLRLGLLAQRRSPSAAAIAQMLGGNPASISITNPHQQATLNTTGSNQSVDLQTLSWLQQAQGQQAHNQLLAALSNQQLTSTLPRSPLVAGSGNSTGPNAGPLPHDMVLSLLLGGSSAPAAGSAPTSTQPTNTDAMDTKPSATLQQSEGHQEQKEEVQNVSTSTKAQHQARLASILSQETTANPQSSLPSSANANSSTSEAATSSLQSGLLAQLAGYGGTNPPPTASPEEKLALLLLQEQSRTRSVAVDLEESQLNAVAQAIRNAQTPVSQAHGETLNASMIANLLGLSNPGLNLDTKLPSIGTINALITSSSSNTNANTSDLESICRGLGIAMPSSAAGHRMEPPGKSAGASSQAENDLTATLKTFLENSSALTPSAASAHHATTTTAAVAAAAANTSYAAIPAVPSSSSMPPPVQMKRGRAVKFPKTLHAILMQLDQDGRGIAGFSADGSAFVIRKPDEFAKEVLPEHFKMSNFSSFQRQINLYDFQRVKGELDISYRHPLFHRDKPELCITMRRTKRKNRQERPPSYP